MIFIQWTRSGNHLSVSLQQALVTSDGSVDQENVSFTGTIAGNGLTLQLNQGLGSTRALVGQLQGSGFTLTCPGAANNLIQIAFAPSGLDGYDTAVAQRDSPTPTTTTTPATTPAPASGSSYQTPQATTTATAPPKQGVGNCPTFTGPGDNVVHSANFNAYNV